MANTKDNVSNFDGLVSGISEHERKVLLNKIKKNPDSKAEIGVSTKDMEETPAQILLARAKEMSIFQRLWFYIKSAITSTPIDRVINEYLVKRIAAGVEKEYSGLINSRKQLLLDAFYEKISQLKIAADFFTPLLVPFEDNPDFFYVVLGSVVMPEIHNQIETESDPKQYPYTKTLNKEMRASLLHKMEAVEDNIPMDIKAVMYTSVRSVEWLRQFVKLPFDRLMNKFHYGDSGVRELSFSQCTNEILAFANVFSDIRPITTEVLQALKMVKENQLLNFEEGSQDGFINAAQAQCSVISVFNNTVPVKGICCVVTQNALFNPPMLSGGEDWLLRYKSQQKVIFDRRWNLWLHEYKKFQVKLKVESYFGLSALPHFPYRPWEKVFGNGVHFDYALTLGFLYAYFKNIYSEYQRTLNVIILEGDFSINENRVEFTDVTKEMARISSELDEIASNLSMGGEVGRALVKYDSAQSKNKTSIERVNVMISEVEKKSQDVINHFGKASRSLESILSAITGEKSSSYYGPLTNLAKIQGKENKIFRDNLNLCRVGITNGFEIVKELEALDHEKVD